MNTPTGFAALLTGLRKRAGLTQVDLADVVGLSRSNIVKWEGGSKPPRRDICDQLAAALRYAPEALWQVAAWERIGADERLVVDAELRQLRALAAVSADDAELSYSSVRAVIEGIGPSILPGLLNVLNGLPAGAALAGVSREQLAEQLTTMVETLRAMPPHAAYLAVDSCCRVTDAMSTHCR